MNDNESAIEDAQTALNGLGDNLAVMKNRVFKPEDYNDLVRRRDLSVTQLTKAIFALKQISFPDDWWSLPH